MSAHASDCLMVFCVAANAFAAGVQFQRRESSQALLSIGMVLVASAALLLGAAR